MNKSNQGRALSNKFLRLRSLDVFRGITIVLMILVNSPGNNTAYAWLSHSHWNGCTLADVVFPFFIFIIGVSVIFSLSKASEQGLSKKITIKKIINRSIIIFLIGLFLNAFPYHLIDFSTLRIFGVLQRIAICYLIVALLYITTSLRTQIIIAVVTLMGYWLLLKWVPVPGFGPANLTPENNITAYVDRLFFSAGHLYEKVYDPEGFLSTFPAIITALIGSFTGRWLLSKYTPEKKLRGMIIAGFIAAFLGWMWGFDFPINKTLWTSSYVLWTSGLALLLLALCYFLVDIKKSQKWFIPFEIFGKNALIAYFLHMFFLKIQAMIKLTNAEGVRTNLRVFITDHLFSWTTPKNASLLYALSYIGLWLLVLTVLYRKKIYIKV